MIAYKYQGDNYSYCAECSHVFWFGETVFHSKHGYRNFLCQKCAEKENITVKQYLDSILENKLMPNIKITAEVGGKQVPLETISTETFEAIKALEKPKEIPVARLANYCTWPRLLFRPSRDFSLKIGNVYALDLKTGNVSASWSLGEEDSRIKRYGNIKPL